MAWCSMASNTGTRASRSTIQCAFPSPLLITVGEWDNDTPPVMAQAIFPMATAAPWKRLAVLGGGTHTMLMERNRMLLFRTVQQFLEEAPPGPDVHQ